MKPSNNLIVRRLVVGQLQTNCYIVADNKEGEAIIIDPGDDAEYIQNALRDLNVSPQQIIATHGHFDHILAAFELQHAYEIPFWIHEKDRFLVERMQETAKYFLHIDVHDLPPKLDMYLVQSQSVAVGEFVMHIVETPGHTPGSVCLYFKKENVLFTGDTIFADGGVGRTDFSYSSADDLKGSIKTILNFSETTQLYSGHGALTSVKAEKSFHLL